MAARYGHFALEELRDAVESISRTENAEVLAGYPRNPPQAGVKGKENVN
jgi:hypothetical protein